MLFLVVLTGAAGLPMSMLLLRLHVHKMSWRYPISAVAAYGVFMALIRL